MEDPTVLVLDWAARQSPADTPCALLGFNSVEGVPSSKAVRTHFRRLAKLVHPDRCAHPLARDVFDNMRGAMQRLLQGYRGNTRAELAAWDSPVGQLVAKAAGEEPAPADTAIQPFQSTLAQLQRERFERGAIDAFTRALESRPQGAERSFQLAPDLDFGSDVAAATAYRFADREVCAPCGAEAPAPPCGASQHAVLALPGGTSFSHVPPAAGADAPGHAAAGAVAPGHAVAHSPRPHTADKLSPHHPSAAPSAHVQEAGGALDERIRAASPRGGDEGRRALSPAGPRKRQRAACGPGVAPTAASGLEGDPPAAGRPHVAARQLDASECPPVKRPRVACVGEVET